MAVAEELTGPEGTQETDQGALYNAILAQLRQIIVPAIDDRFAANRAKSLARIVKYLRGVDRYGAVHRAAEVSELAGLLGHPVTSLPGARAELAAAVGVGRLDVGDLLVWAWCAVRREHELLGEAMGVLARRHLPGLGPSLAP